MDVSKSINCINEQFFTDLTTTSQKQGQLSNSITTVAGGLSSAEANLLKAFNSSGEGESTIKYGEGKSITGTKDQLINFFQAKYNKALRIFEAFQKMLEASQQIMMRVINRISSR